MQPAASFHLSSQELRQELREELRRFASESLKDDLAELGMSMRRGVREDFESIFLLSKCSGLSASQPGAGLVSFGVDAFVNPHPTYIDNGEATESKQPLIGLFGQADTGAEASQGNGLGDTAASDAPRKPRSSVSSGVSNLEEDAEDQLGWISRCRRGFNAKKELAKEEKRRSLKRRISSRISESGERRTSLVGSELEAFRASLIRGETDAAKYPSGDQESSGDASECGGMIQSERVPGDMTPATVIEKTPLPPSGMPALLPAPLPAISDDPPASTPLPKKLPAMNSDQQTSVGEACEDSSTASSMLRARHPKTYLAKKELAVGSHNVPGNHSDKAHNCNDAKKKISHVSEGSSDSDIGDSKRAGNGSRSSNSVTFHQVDRFTKVKNCILNLLFAPVVCCVALVTTPASDVVASYQFDYGSALLVFLNAVCIGVETDYSARYLVADLPMRFVVIDFCFCVFFTLELVMRIYVYRRSFFTMPGYKWNIFDLLLVLLQIIEEVMGFIALTQKSESDRNAMTSNLSIMRVLRVLRLVRVIRLVRVMNLVNELRTIVVAIFGTLQSLLWTMALLFMVMYIMGVYLTQLVTAELLDNPDENEKDDLQEFYGNLPLSILSLFQAITNGVDWGNMTAPLTTYVHPALPLVFCLYVGFSLFALMNIVTGVFVESALQTAKNDKDMFLLHHMTQLFTRTDVDGSGEIDWLEFQSQLDTPDMQEYFKAVDLDTEEARDLFRLIDCDGSGQIDAEEFVHGCLRLRGPAKAIDLATFMHDYQRTTLRWKKHLGHMEKCLDKILTILPGLAQTSSTALRVALNGLESKPGGPKKKGLTSL